MLHVVTPFPDLLDLAFFVPLILRLALGVYVIAISSAKTHPTEGVKEVESANTLIRSLLFLAGISLIAGLYVQISALVCSVLFLVSILNKKIHLSPHLSRAELILLFIIAFCLIFTGAGPFAVDYPF